MKRARYERIEAVFLEAVEREGAVRAAYLERACAGDTELRASVERMLAQDEKPAGAGAAIEAGAGRRLIADAARPAGSPATSDTAAPLHLTQVGRYRIRERIAEGGMGAVYLAEQDHPRRPVALKMIRPGVLSAETLRRFRLEAELLGRLQHPGIARIYEAGEAETEFGRQPFFAMEHIEGEELRRYARARNLDVASRLELMARVCDAVHHAHQNWIVHRDLKPENILVVEEESTTSSSPDTPGRFSRVGQPKVLDFGVARATDSDVQVTSMHTDVGQLIGTLTYMSPEQVTGDSRRLDTRSDVYALGAILYELLCGRPPLELAGRPIPEAVRMIRETDPSRVGLIDTDLRGDVDAILCKALDKDRERRYASASALADDIRRFLSSQPISARPPTLTYQLSRFVRRNKVFVGAAALAILCLAVGLVLALIARRDEARQRVVAERETESARRATYVAQMRAATAFWVAGDRQSVREQLAALPAAERGWECDFLRHAVEDDLEFHPMRVDVRVTPRPLRAGETEAILALSAGGLRLVDLDRRIWTDRPCPVPDLLAVARLRAGSGMLLGDRRGRLWRSGLRSGSPPREIWRSPWPIVAIDVTGGDERAALLTRRGGQSLESTVYLLDLANSRVVASLHRPAYLGSATFDPAGLRLALVERDTGVLLWQPARPGRLTSLCGHTGVPLHAHFSSDGRSLATTGYDRTIKIWDLDSGRLRRSFGPVRHTASCAVFHPDGKTLITGHAGARIRVWNRETGACERLTSGAATTDVEAAAIRQVALLSAGDLICGIGLDGMHVRPYRDPSATILRHRSGLYAFAYDVDFSPSGRHLVSAGWDGTVRIWDVATWRAVAVLDGRENALWARYSPDGERILSCSQIGFPVRRLRLWRVDDLGTVATLEYQAAHAPGLYLRGADSVLLGVHAELWVVDAATLAVQEKRPMPAPVWSLALSPDATRVACGMADGGLLVLDAATRRVVSSVAAHGAGILALAYSPDGSLLATGGDDEVIRFWSTASGAEVRVIPTRGARENLVLRFSADGRRLFAGSRRTSIGVRDVETGLEVARLHGHDAYVHGLATSPDGRILASASGDNTVRIWDTRPLSERVEMRRRMLAAEEAVRPVVESLRRKHRSVASVTAAIVADPSLDALHRAAAWNVLMADRRED